MALRDTSLRERVHEIVFEADTAAGKAFDVGLLVLIALSVLVICLESVADYRADHGAALYVLEWVFTGLFTLEYLVRLWCVRRPLAYATSFFGVLDLVAVLPAYLMLVIVDAHHLGTVRVLRLVRVFRVLKLVRYLGEARALHAALRASAPKIVVFLLAISCLVVVVGSVMYVVEGRESGFDSIPRSIYWAIVTLTTVGYGDISPSSGLGQGLAALVMLMGYGIIAVPTGIVSAELVRGQRESTSTQSCPGCAAEGHVDDAVFCYRCGERL
ncbi:MAG: ion transporter [Planctomycetes bacterium]|nr:ion transporter [Planctomycetota bacterium]